MYQQNATHDPLDPKNWIGPKELASLLGYKTVQTVYNKISRGEDLPPRHYMNGVRLRFFRPEVEPWLAKRSLRLLTAEAQLKAQAEAAQQPKPWHRPANP